MPEFFVAIDLSAPVPDGTLIPESIGQQCIGVIVNNQLPAGVQFKIGRKGTGDGIVLGGATSAVGGGDALLNFFCPPASQGLVARWNVAAPGSFALLCIQTADGGDASAARA